MTRICLMGHRFMVVRGVKITKGLIKREKEKQHLYKVLTQLRNLMSKVEVDQKGLICICLVVPRSTKVWTRE